MKKFCAVLVALVLVLSLSAVSFGAIPVKYSVVFPATGTQADGARLLGQIIEKVSEGRLVMEFYPSAQLGDKASTFEGLSMGTVEMTECAATDLSAFNDMWSVFSLPYLWDNGSQAIKTVMKDSVRKILEADAEENGFIIIAWTDMGAIGTPLAFSELYIALQQGTVDGLDHTPSAIVANGLQELCKYFSLTEHFTIPDPVFVSKVWFDGLSKENQEALLEAGRQFSAQKLRSSLTISSRTRAKDRKHYMKLSLRRASQSKILWSENQVPV